MYQNALPAVLLLIAMIGLAWALQRYRRHLPGASAQRGPRLQVMNSLSLGPQHRVVTVQVGEGEAAQCLVLGVAPGGVTALHSLAMSELVDTQATTPVGASVPAPGSFAARLAQLAQPKKPTKSP